MPVTPTATYSLPIAPAGNVAAGSAWVPGTGAVPLRGGTPNSTNDQTFGPVELTQLLVELGGSAYVPCTAATATVVKAAPGRLCKVIVVATGTAAVSIYDNASAASGNILFTVPAAAATGSIYDLHITATAGIYVGGTTNTPALNCTYF
jgi:hypothetical protein